MFLKVRCRSTSFIKLVLPVLYAKRIFLLLGFTSQAYLFTFKFYSFETIFIMLENFAFLHIGHVILTQLCSGVKKLFHYFLHSSRLSKIVCCLVLLIEGYKHSIAKISIVSCLFLLEYHRNNFTIVHIITLLMSGDVHPNPGPFISSVKFCHWNLNSILARNSIKLSLIEVYDSIHKFDLIALSETYLNNSISNEDIPLQGFSHNVFRSDHPSNAIYYFSVVQNSIK